jgi:hypothetical protein
MPPSRTGEMSASMAVLCLVVEQTDTVAGVGVRLAQRFPDAGWARNAVHNNIPSLAKQGLVCLAKKGPPGKASLDTYRATSEGVAQVRKWIRESAVVPPVLRDALQGKLAFSEEAEDVLGLIATVRDEEDACRLKYADAHRGDMTARQVRLRRRSRGRRAILEEMMGDVKLADEAAVWGFMVNRLKLLRENLKDVLEELEGSGSVPGADDG